MTLHQQPPQTEAPGRRGRAARLVGPAVTAGVIGGLTVALHYRDPHVEGSWGFCPFNALTGLDCPGCGGLRAVHHLTDLDVGAAASSNLLFVLAIPVLVGLWFVWTRRAWRGGTTATTATRTAPRHRLLWGQLAIAAIVLFTVVRNLPIGGWHAA